MQSSVFFIFLAYIYLELVTKARGIAGIFDLKSRPVDEWRVKSMVESMAHRGPNGQGTYFEDAVALGH